MTGARMGHVSVVERSRLTAFDSATVSAAQLVYKAHLRTTTKWKNSVSLLHWAARHSEALLRKTLMIASFQSNEEGMTLMDARIPSKPTSTVSSDAG